MIGLGGRVKDKITGFTGIVIARTEWLNGCTRVGVQSQELKDGKPIEQQWFDETQVIVVAEEVEYQPPRERVVTGGPQHDPTPRQEERR